MLLPAFCTSSEQDIQTMSGDFLWDMHVISITSNHLMTVLCKRIIKHTHLISNIWLGCWSPGDVGKNIFKELYHKTTKQICINHYIYICIIFIHSTNVLISHITSTCEANPQDLTFTKPCWCCWEKTPLSMVAPEDSSYFGWSDPQRSR